MPPMMHGKAGLGGLVPPSIAPAIEQLMAFDFGTQRTGIAVGNRITQTATALPTVVGKGDVKWQKIDRLVHEWAPHALVIGVPFHPDGASHVNTRRARGFGNDLKARYHLMVFEVDERYTTVEAIARGASDADAMAACLILEQFLRSVDL